MSDPTLCLYHGNCQDGFSAAYAVWKRFGDSVAYVAAFHGRPPPDVTGHHVLIVDFSYKRPVIEDMARQAASIVILDHHKSAEADLAPLLADATVSGVFDMNRSGAVIAWEYYHDNAAPQLLAHVQDRDLWQFQLAETREISSCLFSHEYSFAQWDRMVSACDDPLTRAQLVREGAAIERKSAKDIRELLPTVTRRMTIGGVVVPVANLPYQFASDAGNQLAQNEPFAACYYDSADGRVFSLRSTDQGLDVSAIAMQYGGGGHRNAAGFKAAAGWEGEV